MRIDVVTPHFPLPGHEHYGRSKFETLARLNELADVRVFCTVAQYPPLLRSRTKQGQDLTRLEWFVPELKGQYVPYPAVPMLSRPLNAYACYRRLYEAVRRNGPADLRLNYWLYPEGCAAVMLGRKFGFPSLQEQSVPTCVLDAV